MWVCVGVQVVDGDLHWLIEVQSGRMGQGGRLGVDPGIRSPADSEPVPDPIIGVADSLWIPSRGRLRPVRQASSPPTLLPANHGPS